MCSTLRYVTLRYIYDILSALCNLSWPVYLSLPVLGLGFRPPFTLAPSVSLSLSCAVLSVSHAFILWLTSSSGNVYTNNNALCKHAAYQNARCTGCWKVGAFAFAKVLSYNNRLQHLNLAENGISTDGMVAIADALHRNIKLTWLGLYQNEQVQIIITSSLSHTVFYSLTCCGFDSHQAVRVITLI